jgi:hypothetical protein
MRKFNFMGNCFTLPPLINVNSLIRALGIVTMCLFYESPFSQCLYPLTPTDATAYMRPKCEENNFFLNETDCYPFLPSEHKGNIIVKVKIFRIIPTDPNFLPVESIENILDAFSKSRDIFAQHGIFFKWDCTITDVMQEENNVSNSLLYNYNYLTILIFPPHGNFTGESKAEGPPGNNGRLTTAGVGGTQIWQTQYTNISDNVLAHEIGHVLGLHHTYNGGDGFTNVDNWFNGCKNSGNELANSGEYISPPFNTGCCCGDFVNDTNGQQGESLSTEPPFDCIDLVKLKGQGGYHNSKVDKDGTPWDPDETNIMNGVNFGCADRITFGQSMRIKWIANKLTNPTFYILKNQPNSNAQIHFEDFEQVSDVIWENGFFILNEVYITGTYVVKSGSKLTIESNFNVLFGPEGKMLVEPGAELIVRGKMTSLGCDVLWQGIVVQGNANVSQFNDGSSLTVSQGKITTFEGSEISNARIAVHLENGGIGLFNGTNFDRNITSVYISEYNNFWPYGNPGSNRERDNISIINNCTFRIDPIVKVASSLPPAIGLKLERVRGIKVDNSQFLGPNGVPPITPYECRGIESNSAGVICREHCLNPAIQPCGGYGGSTFKNLDYGVIVNGLFGGSRFLNVIGNAKFDDFEIGILNLFSNNSEYYMNEFNIGNTGTPKGSSEGKGIAFFGESTGWKCEQNIFNYVNTNSNPNRSIGSWAYSTGISNNTIRNNQYTGLSVGNLANYTNGITSGFIRTGLNYDCNKNIGSQEFDFASVFGDVRSLQFLTNTFLNQIGPCYNIFANSALSSAKDFSNEGTTINYYYLENAILHNPDDVLNVNGIPREAFENPCPNNFCLGGCPVKPNDPPSDPPSDPNDKFLQIKGFINSVKNNTSLSSQLKSESIARLQEDLSNLIDETIHFYLLDTITEAREDSLLAWMERSQTFSYDLARIKLLKEKGQNILANSVWNELPNRYSVLNAQGEIDAFKSSFNFLSERENFEVTSEDSLYLENLVLSQDKRISTMAISLLGHLGKLHKIEPIFPSSENPEFRISNVVPTLKNSEEVKIFPNPTKDMIEISFSNTIWPNVRKIKLLDLNGKVIQTKINPSHSESMSLSSLAAGAYIIEISLEDKSNIVKTIFKQ